MGFQLPSRGPSKDLMTVNMNGKGGSTLDRRRTICTAILDRQPDIVFAQEIAAPRSPQWKMEIEGYDFCNTEKEAGIAWRTTTFEMIKRIDSSDKMKAISKVKPSFTEFVSRTCIVILRHPQSDKPMLFVSWHGPHYKQNMDKKKMVFEELLDFVDALCTQTKVQEVVIGGDFNLRSGFAGMKNKFQIISDDYKAIDYFVYRDVTLGTIKRYEFKENRGNLDHEPVTASINGVDDLKGLRCLKRPESAAPTPETADPASCTPRAGSTSRPVSCEGTVQPVTYQGGHISTRKPNAAGTSDEKTTVVSISCPYKSKTGNPSTSGTSLSFSFNGSASQSKNDTGLPLLKVLPTSNTSGQLSSLRMDQKPFSSTTAGYSQTEQRKGLSACFPRNDKGIIPKQQSGVILSTTITFKTAKEAGPLVRIPSQRSFSDVAACPHCGKVMKNEHGVAVHIGKVHAELKTRAAEQQRFTTSYESDALTEKGSNVLDAVTTSSFVEPLSSSTCPDCGKVLKNAHGMAVHRGKMHKRRASAPNY